MTHVFEHEAVEHLAAWGFDVTYISLDGSANNRAFIKMMLPATPLEINMIVSSPYDLSMSIAIIPDHAHLIKIRNSAFNSSCGQQPVGHRNSLCTAIHKSSGLVYCTSGSTRSCLKVKSFCHSSIPPFFPNLCGLIQVPQLAGPT